MSMRPHTVIDHQRPAMMPCVWIVMSPAPSYPISTAACIYAGIDIWRPMQHKLNASLETALWGLVSIEVEYCWSSFVKLIAPLDPNNGKGIRLPKNDFALSREYPVNALLDEWSSKQHFNSKIIDHQCDCKNGTRPSLFTTSLFTVLGCGNSVNSIDSFHAKNKKSFFTKSGLSSVLSVGN